MHRSMLFPMVLALALDPCRAEEPAPQSSVAADFIRADVPAALPEDLSRALRAVQLQPLSAHIAYLADPLRQGRGLGTKGLDAAAEYVAARLAEAGVAPFGKGRSSYFQSVPMDEVRDLDGELSLELRRGGARIRRSWPHGGECRLPELAPGVLSAPLVFAGYGIREDALGHDDFRNLDVRGKIVLLVGSMPSGPRWLAPELKARWASGNAEDRYDARLEILERLGAKAVVAIEAEPGKAAEPAPFFRPPHGGAAAEEPPLARVSGECGRRLLEALGSEGIPSPRELPGARAAIRTTGKVRSRPSRNVIGLVEGSDLREEAIVLGAHLDHLGMPGGVVHPGADDNASGVAALLEIARTFAAAPVKPRRTLIFTFWTGEEDGKFGSSHYLRHPRWPLSRTRAYINLDMIGHPWTPEELRALVKSSALPGGEAFLAGLQPACFAEPGLAQWAPELGEVLALAGRCTGMSLHLDRGDGWSGGSDYRGFARARIPWVRFFGDYFPQYHKPGDTPEKLDAAQVHRMARLAFATAWFLARR